MLITNEHPLKDMLCNNIDTQHCNVLSLLLQLLNKMLLIIMLQPQEASENCL